MLSEKACAFTGHRENKLPWGADELDARCIRLKERIRDAVEAVYRSGVTHFICGMATGADMYFGEAVVKLREEHGEVTLEAAVPCEGQSRRWAAANRRRYNDLLAQCDYETVIQRDYSPECMMLRNRYMVDSAQILIAAYNGKSGGTRNTILYAMNSGREIIQLPVEE